MLWKYLSDVPDAETFCDLEIRKTLAKQNTAFIFIVPFTQVKALFFSLKYRKNKQQQLVEFTIKITFFFFLIDVQQLIRMVKQLNKKTFKHPNINHLLKPLQEDFWFKWGHKTEHDFSFCKRFMFYLVLGPNQCIFKNTSRGWAIETETIKLSLPAAILDKEKKLT